MRRLLMLVVPVLLIACGGAGSSPTKETGGDPSDLLKVVYTASPDGVREIFTSQLDGTFSRRLTTNDWVDQNAKAWESDVVFESVRDGVSGVYRTSLSGMEPEFIAQGSNPDIRDGVIVYHNENRVYRDGVDLGEGNGAAIGPDGRIAFAVNDEFGVRQLAVMDADGSNRQNLGVRLRGTPSWGIGVIVFSSEQDGVRGLFRISPDGSGFTRLTATTAEALDGEPSVSPDGQTVLFSRGGQLMRMEVFGSSTVTPITSLGDAVLVSFVR